MKILAGRVAFITGAGSGIGAAAARLFASNGCKVGLFSRTASELEEIAREVGEDGAEALPLTGDVGSEKDVFGAVEKLEREWGQLDIVFANAGVNGVWAPLEELSVEEWDETMRINLRGTFLTVKAALPLLKVRGGSVIITSSVNGTRMFSNAGASAYATTKAAQAAFAKMLAVEFGRHHIRVNVICPGAISTQINQNTEHRAQEGIAPKVEFPQGQIPLTGKMPGSSGQVAQLALFLASEASDHITGAEIFIDGGQSLLQG